MTYFDCTVTGSTMLLSIAFRIHGVRGSLGHSCLLCCEQLMLCHVTINVVHSQPGVLQFLLSDTRHLKKDTRASQLLLAGSHSQEAAKQPRSGKDVH